MSNLEIDFSQNKEKVSKKIQNIKKRREKKKRKRKPTWTGPYETVRNEAVHALIFIVLQ